MRHEVVGDGEGGGSGADAGDAFAVLFGGGAGEEVGDVAAEVGRDAFEAADGDGFFDLSVVGGQASAAAGGLAGAVAGAAEDGGKDVAFAVHHVGVGVAALGDEADVFGYVGVGGTGPLAVHYLMEVVGIADFRGIHGVVSVSSAGAAVVVFGYSI